MAIVYKGKAKQLPYSNQFNELYAMVRGAGYKQLELVFYPPVPGKSNINFHAVRFFNPTQENGLEYGVRVNLAHDNIQEILQRSLERHVA